MPSTRNPLAPPSRRRVAGLAIPRGVQKVARPLGTIRGVQRPTGMRRFGVNENPVPVNSIWVMPGWFRNGNNSADEWPPYEALILLLGPPDQGNWTYQTRTSLAFGKLGTAKPDFLIFQQPFLVVRVQSIRYHIAVNSAKASYDFEQRIYLQRIGYQVIDIFPEQYQPATRDNGKRILSIMRDALNGRQRSNPRDIGTSIARG